MSLAAFIISTAFYAFNYSQYQSKASYPRGLDPESQFC